MDDKLEDALNKLYEKPMRTLFLSDLDYYKLKGSIEFLNKNLCEKIKNKILNKKIIIIRTEAPSSQRNCIIDKTIKHLIAVDLNILKVFNFTDEEISCVILHELGHIFNKPPHMHKKNDEFYADDFVIEQGEKFKNCLFNGMKKYLEKSPIFLTEQSMCSIKDRMRRIENG